MNWLKNKASVGMAVREAIAANHMADSVIDRHQPVETRPLGEGEARDPLAAMVEATTESIDDIVADSTSEFDTADRITGYAKLSKLVDDDFPFDESQLTAINGLVRVPYGCLTGAAGTGKTTSTKKLVDSLMESASELGLQAVNMRDYWRKGDPTDDGDEYESTEDWIPSICMVSFTGRATQMIKKNFPRDWHGNIMTIHRCLGFYPEKYEDFDDETQQVVWKRRFVPTYGPDLLLPWDIVIIDEAGMLGLDLWHQLVAALKPGCRIYMIGDINQLPPVHGKPIFGFALAKWPSWELTHVHRQQGVNNPIVDNAWRVLNGRMPVSDGRFQLMELLDKQKRPADATYASRLVRGLAPKFRDAGFYDPIRDTIITPINGEEGARGYALGQLPLNREFAMIFNPTSENPRFIIDAGRDHKNFAIGDKVMATKNDWEAGITNGMTGIITDINVHEGYTGNRQRFGRVEDVAKFMAEEAESTEYREFSLSELEDSYDAIDKAQADKKEKKERGPASHIVTVRFGDEEHGIEIPFQTLSEVTSLMTAYVVTCHKMQGGESPTIIIILHDAHKAMLYREWLYTAITRASEKCIVLYTRDALRVALNKQSIKGQTLKEKVAAFNALVDPKGLMGAAMKVVLPVADEVDESDMVMNRQALQPAAMRHMTTDDERKGGVADLLRKRAERMKPTEPLIREVHIHHHTTIVVDRERKDESTTVEPAQTIDGGEVKAQRIREAEAKQVESAKQLFHNRLGGQPVVARLMAPVDQPVLVSQMGAYQTLQAIEVAAATKLLSAPPKKVNPFAKKLGLKQ